MDAQSNSWAAKILCVEGYSALPQRPCDVLAHSGYDSISASPQAAGILLRSRKFDLIVVLELSDYDLQKTINLADGADVLALGGFTGSSELIHLVAERLSRRQGRA